MSREGAENLKTQRNHVLGFMNITLDRTLTKKTGENFGWKDDIKDFELQCFSFALLQHNSQKEKVFHVS